MNNPTIPEARTLREQAEERIFDVLMQFEDITGLQVTGISISRYRPAGFGAHETMEINIKTEQI